MKNGVLMMFPSDAETRAGKYFHCELALAEGFIDAGIPVYGNFPYWRDTETSPWTIPQMPPSFVPDLTIHSSYNLMEEDRWWDRFRCPGQHVILDAADGPGFICATDPSRRANLALRVHYNPGFKYQDNTKPWAFGLTKRLLMAFSEVPESHAPVRGVVSNSRHNLHIRQWAQREVISKLGATLSVETGTDGHDAPELGWLHRQTIGRHSPRYFASLDRHQFTDAFAGNFMVRSGLGTDLGSRLHRRVLTTWLGCKQRLEGVRDYDSWNAFMIDHCGHYLIYQSDSWRWWESLLSRSVPLHLEIKGQGWVLPVMPGNNEHYLGLENWDADAYVHHVLNLGEAERQDISSAGRAWAIRHYSPRAAVSRLSRWLGMSDPFGGDCDEGVRREST